MQINLMGRTKGVVLLRRKKNEVEKIWQILLKQFPRQAKSFQKPGHQAMNIIGVGDAGIRTLNRKFRGKDKVTDVLTFLLDDEGVGNDACLVGEIYVNTSYVLRRKNFYGFQGNAALLFIVTHAMLHVLGVHHPDEQSSHRNIAIQAQILQRLGYMRIDG